MTDVPIDLLQAALEATDILIMSRDETVRHLFENAGFRHIKTVRQEFEEANKVILAGQCDVVVLDDLFFEEGTKDFIKSLRSGDYGDNICLPVVILISDITTELARDAIYVGADDVVIKPLSVNDVNKRMRALLKRDLQYIVTEDYIGPNRRSAARTNPEKDNLIDIPNAFRMKAEGYQQTAREISDLMVDASREIYNRSAALDGQAIQDLIQEAVSNPDNIQNALRKLRPLVASFAKKLHQTDYHHIGDLCDLLTDIVRTIQGPKDTQNIEILALVGQALQLSFENTKQSKAAAAEIISLIKKR